MKNIKDNYKINISNNLDSYLEVWDVNSNCNKPNIIQTRWRENAKCGLCITSHGWYTGNIFLCAYRGLHILIVCWPICNWVLEFLA